jgi:hypothetical protein
MPVEDRAQDVGEDVVERRVVRQLDDGKSKCIGGADHRLRQRLDVAPRLERESGEPTAGQHLHKVIHRARVVA